MVADQLLSNPNQSLQKAMLAAGAKDDADLRRIRRHFNADREQWMRRAHQRANPPRPRPAHTQRNTIDDFASQLTQFMPSRETMTVIAEMQKSLQRAIGPAMVEMEAAQRLARAALKAYDVEGIARTVARLGVPAAFVESKR